MASLFFTVTHIFLLGVALYHGLYGLRTIVFELGLKPATEMALYHTLKRLEPESAHRFC